MRPWIQEAVRAVRLLRLGRDRNSAEVFAVLLRGLSRREVP